MNRDDYFLYVPETQKSFSVSPNHLSNIHNAELYRELGQGLRPIYCGTVTNWYIWDSMLVTKVYNYNSEESDTYEFS